jgi:sugar phosphate isomerase/epimerase
VIYASTACLRRTEPLSARLAHYIEAGIRSIELGHGVTLTEPFPWTDWRAGDVRFLIHNYFPPPGSSFVLNLASADGDVRQRSIDLALHALDLSSRLGAPFYSVHAGFVTDPDGFDGSSYTFPDPPPGQRQRAEGRFLESLGVLLDGAASHDIDLLVENNVCPPHLSGKLLAVSGTDCAAICEAVADVRLGILLDTGHLRVSAVTLGTDPAEEFAAVRRFVRAFHVHDNDGTRDRHQPVAADSWVLEVLAASPSAPAVVEAAFDDASALAEHVLWLARQRDSRQAAGES